MAVVAIGLVALLWRVVYLWQVGQDPLSAAAQADGMWSQWGVSQGVLIGLQLGIGVVNCLLVWKLAATLLDHGVGFLAGAMAACYGPSIYMEGQVGAGSWAAFLSLVGLTSLVVWRVHSVWTGLLLGMAGALSGPVRLLVVVGIWCAGKRASRHAAFMVVGWLLGLLSMLLWTGGWSALQPAGAADWPSALARFFWGGEWADLADPYLATEGTIVAALLWHRWLFFPWGAIGPLMLLGLFALWRSRAVAEKKFVLVACLAVIALTVPYGGHPALRTVAVPILLLAAAQGIVQLWVGVLPGRRAVLGWVVLAALVVVCNRGGHVWQERGTVHERQVRARAYEQLAMSANAAREYESAIGFDSAPVGAYVGLARLYGEMGDYRRAGRVYEQARAKFTDAIGLNIRAEQARAYMLADMPREAAKEYQALSDGDPKGDRWLGVLGDARLLMGDVEGALEAYREALVSHPDSARVRYGLARLCESVGRLDEALEAYSLLSAHSAWSVEAGWRSAVLLVERGERQAAEEALNAVLAMDSDQPSALWELGKLLAVDERFVEALSVFERLRDIEPDGYRAHFFLGKLYYRVGRLEEAEAARRLFETRKRRAEVQQAMEDDLNAVLRQFGE